MILVITGSILILLIVISIVGIVSFNVSVKQERVLLFNTSREIDVKITQKDLDDFPDLMKNYLNKVKIVGKPKYCNAIFTQKGKIRTSLEKKWLPFSATQYMSSNNFGFIWKAKALPMLIRDKYTNGKGEVKVSVLGLKNIVLFTGQKVDQSSLGRYLGELIWFPIGFLNPDISWETIDYRTIKATVVNNNHAIEGFFIFNQNGTIDHFETKRYRDTELENFIGEVGEYEDYDGLLIPNTMTAIWDLKKGKQQYFKAAILDYKLIS
ncbi:DUF6544 family protein [Aquimarina sp. AU58]|uniref:DUF6544 family protein n=1 Tax=Aquimarina sp. AU58 TaxID=1874112 RepID=UPI000D641428|nr:DUF6544 family protein [Aquimarina sp. AU58]